MPKYQITAPTGEKYEITAPDGATDKEILAYAQHQHSSTQKTTNALEWSDVPKQAIKNAPESLGNVVGGIGEAVMHPIDTAQGVLDVANGGLQHLLPDSVNEIMHKISPSTSGNVEKANRLSEFYKERYGSEEVFKKALATDPAGVLMDLSTVMGSAGGTFGKIGRAIDPLSATLTGAAKLGEGAAKLSGHVIAPILGATTGAESSAIKTALKAGEAGGTKERDLVKAMRSQSDIGDIVGEAKGALKNMRKANSDTYEASMVGLKNDPTVLDFKPIDKAVRDSLDIGAYEGKSTNASANSTKKLIVDKVMDWKNDNPDIYHTAAGLDALKRAIGDIRDSTEVRTPSRMVADSVYNAIKQEISKQHPEYAQIMNDYGSSAKNSKNIEKTFSLGEKAMEDTTVRKLQSIPRNNVNTNYGNRTKLIEMLAPHGAENIMEKLSGQSLNSWTPRGIAKGYLASEGLLLGSLAPHALGGMLAQSPRLVGEAALLTGKSIKLLKKIAEKSKGKGHTLNQLYQAQELSNK